MKNIEVSTERAFEAISRYIPVVTGCRTCGLAGEDLALRG